MTPVVRGGWATKEVMDIFHMEDVNKDKKVGRSPPEFWWCSSKLRFWGWSHHWLPCSLFSPVQSHRLIAHILTIFDKKCILWPYLAHYCSLISRRQPLIGSQGPCSALIADATMTHFIPLWLQDWHPPPSELSAGGVKLDVEKTQKCIHLNCNKAKRSTPGRAVQRPVMV